MIVHDCAYQASPQICIGEQTKQTDQLNEKYIFSQN